MSESVPRLAVSETSTRVNHTGSWKYLRPVYHDRVAPCNERCPVGIDVEGYMNLLRQDRVEEAIDLLLRENPMPAVTGRVCHHPCELACNRRDFDEAVSVHAVERALGDRALQTHPGGRPGARKERPVNPPVSFRSASRSERIAVVGSGPAGLACAWHLARAGYAVTVFDDAIEPGGMLRQGIPEYRLPRAILDAEIDRIRRMGVAFRCGVRIGRDMDWDALREYDAVFVATGAHRSRKLGVPGEDHADVRSGVEFLKQVNRRRRPPLGERVAIIGGGNTAIDCARTALRLGARPLVLYRRTREEMPAIADEVADAEREGIDFFFLASPSRFVAEDGRLRGVECTRMTLGAPDASGRRRPVPSDDGGFVIPVDTVLTATGEDIDVAPLPGFFPSNGRVATGTLGDIVARESTDTRDGRDADLLLESRRPLFFAGGDLAGDERTVAHALGAGKRAAIGIDRALTKPKQPADGDGVHHPHAQLVDIDREGTATPSAVSGDLETSADPSASHSPGAGPEEVARLRYGPHGNLSMTRWRDDDPVARTSPINDIVGSEQLNLRHFTHRPRHADALLESSQPGFAEVNAGIPWNAAIEEARRCFNCGVCNQCELCLIFCADVAISRRPGGHGFDIDLEYCKGCGICAEECPRGAIVMTREGL